MARGVGVALAFVLLLISVPTMAGITSLIIVPIADTVPPDEYNFQLEFDGSASEFRPNTRLLNTEFGFSGKLEAGIDVNFSEVADQRVFLNAKYAFFDRSDTRLAVGVTTLPPAVVSSPFVVGSMNFGFMSLHLGGIRTSGKNQWFVGMDKYVTHELDLMAEYTSGADNFSAFGLTYQFNDRYSLVLGIEYPNTPGDTLFTVQLDVSGRYRPSGAGD